MLTESGTWDTYALASTYTHSFNMSGLYALFIKLLSQSLTSHDGIRKNSGSEVHHNACHACIHFYRLREYLRSKMKGKAEKGREEERKSDI